jgi:hypothetical protein
MLAQPDHDVTAAIHQLDLRDARDLLLSLCTESRNQVFVRDTLGLPKPADGPVSHSTMMTTTPPPESAMDVDRPVHATTRPRGAGAGGGGGAVLAAGYRPAATSAQSASQYTSWHRANCALPARARAPTPAVAARKRAVSRAEVCKRCRRGYDAEENHGGACVYHAGMCS